MIDAIAYRTGSPYPMGATWDGQGVNFAIYSENADAVELCLFNAIEDDTETFKIKLKERSHHVWHAYLTGIRPGQLYGYRVYGAYDPENGHRFNPNKLLLDPYARAISGKVQWNDALFGYVVGHEDADLSFSDADSAPYMPKSIVIDTAFDWGNDAPLRTPLHETIIYETHVKGFTALHPDVPAELRGTYSGLAHPAMIAYLKELGITAVELMPVHHFIEDRHLREKGLTNYWGYNTIGFFAPDPRYSSAQPDSSQVTEFKTMVRELHAAGIEVILDVVYNHTAEGNHMGPTLSFRGIDNAAYYRLCPDKRYYMDYTGTGNTLNTPMPNVLKLLMDSLRYWIEEMHVDGFRFDLASTLARELHEVDRLGAFFDIIHQDPVISQVKLIAEPWDVGEGGYQVGKFPPGWMEWNGLYRDCMRDYWRGAQNRLPEFAQRLCGSADLYENDYRKPTASINFITAHDGFTLNDLVSYSEKHNEENGENSLDGESENRSCNCGPEGPTDDPVIIAKRDQLKRNFIATLFLSQGVPMLLSGDEIANTQHGNNNAYCQDNELSWINWESGDKKLLEFTKGIIGIRKKHPAFSRRRWFQGLPIRGVGVEDIAWFTPEGNEMNDEYWNSEHAKSVAVFLNGLGLRCLNNEGQKVIDDHFYLLFNASDDPVTFSLPAAQYCKTWKSALDTAAQNHFEENKFEAEQQIEVQGKSIVLLTGPSTGNDAIPQESLPELTTHE